MCKEAEATNNQLTLDMDELLQSLFGAPQKGQGPKKGRRLSERKEVFTPSAYKLLATLVP